MRQNTAQLTHEHLQFPLPMNARKIVNPDTGAAVPVFLRLQNPNNHLSMRLFLTDRSSVFTIAGDVKYRPKLSL